MISQWINVGKERTEVGRLFYLFIYCHAFSTFGGNKTKLLLGGSLVFYFENQPTKFLSKPQRHRGTQSIFII